MTRDLARIAGIVVASCLLVAILAAGAWNLDPFGRRKAAETRADAAEVQAEVAASGAAIADTVATNTAKVRKAAGDTRHALAASTDLDSDLAIWGTGIDRVRAEGHAPANPGVAEPTDADH